MASIPLRPGSYYHIFNRDNSHDNIFYESEDDYHFLRLYEKYIRPIANTFAWCLLKNHFLFLVYINANSEIDTKSLKFSTVEKLKVVNASKQFSHLFNAYSQAINKRHKRTGSLPEKNFERKWVKTDDYFRKLIIYIHINPVHHGFCESIAKYPWSFYGSVLSEKPNKLHRNGIIELFEDVENFKLYHSEPSNLDDISELLME